MRILFVEGYLKERGNTAMLGDAVIHSLRARGQTVDVVGLRDRAVNDCLGCGKCADSRKCVQRDDMEVIYEKILAADALVLSSPIYMWHMTAALKAFVDRLYCITDKLAGKKLGLVLTAGGDAFDGLSLTVASVKALANYSGMAMADTFFRAPAGDAADWDQAALQEDAKVFCENLLAAE